ncbi:MAG: hypothetical protein ACOC44_19550 [Promethearchaeia archaeon]
MEYYVAFDIAHKPRGKINENLTQLRDHLNKNDLLCYEFLETPITEEVLNRYDILVFVCPDFAKISHQEILEIENWVRNDGGGLLLLSHAGGDKGRNSNLSELAERFGIAFESDQVLDDEKNLGLENRPRIDNFNPPHPITEGVDSLCYRAGCSLSIMGESLSIAVSNETSEPFSCPLICVAEPDHGRVCAIGSYEMFRDDTSGGFDYEEHSKLALNLFEWLISDYRQEVREGDSVAQPNEGQTASPQASHETQEFSYDDQVPEIDVSFRISEKSDLLKILKSFMAELNTMKGIVEQLIDKAVVSDEEFLSLKQAQKTSQPRAEETYSYNDYEQEAYNQPEQANQAVPEATGAQQQSPGGTSGIHNLKEPPLTALPPRPEDLKTRKRTTMPEIQTPTELSDISETTEEMNGIDEDLDDLLGEGEKEEEEIEEEEIEEEEEEKIDREELKAEKEKLKSKLKSNENLLEFLGKQKESGAIDKKKYEKQSSRLKKDVKKIEKRIKEIDSILEEQ